MEEPTIETLSSSFHDELLGEIVLYVTCNRGTWEKYNLDIKFEGINTCFAVIKYTDLKIAAYDGTRLLPDDLNNLIECLICQPLRNGIMLSSEKILYLLGSKINKIMEWVFEEAHSLAQQLNKLEIMEEIMTENPQLARELILKKIFRGEG